jgi:hypothetical protein
MATDFFGQNFEKMVKAAIEVEINRAAEPIIKQALTDMENKMRERVAAQAVRIAREFEFQRDREHFLMTVRIDPDKVEF